MLPRQQQQQQLQQQELLAIPYCTDASWGGFPSETVKAHLTFALQRKTIAVSLSHLLSLFCLFVLLPAYNDVS